jgi:uncharacterized protein YdhG (YjbR/CyaY superfamily)
MPKAKPTTIAEYISSAPKEAQKNLREMYAILRKAAPGAAEGIKWRSPVFEDKRILFKTGKGSIQFPHDKRLPKALIRKIAALRVTELREKDVRCM